MRRVWPRLLWVVLAAVLFPACSWFEIEVIEPSPTPGTLIGMMPSQPARRVEEKLTGPPAPELPKQDPRVVEAVRTGKRAASYEIYLRAYRWWFACNVARSDWDVLEAQAKLLVGQPGRPVPPASDYVLLLLEARRDRDLLVGEKRFLELCRSWLAARPESVIARTAFARVGLEELWGGRDNEKLLSEIRQALDPAFVSAHPDPELVCALLELDLFEGADDATWKAHLKLFKQPYFGASLLQAVRGSEWFLDSAKPWYAGIEPGQRAVTAARIGRYAFASSPKRKSRVSRLTLPEDEEARDWALLVKANPKLDFHLRNRAAKALLKSEPKLAASLLEGIGPNADISVWKTWRDFRRARHTLLGGTKGGEKFEDPTYDLEPLQIRKMGLEGVLLTYQVLELLLRERADELQTVGEALHNEDDRLPNGISKFAVFLEAISPNALASDEHRGQVFATVEAWRNAYPDADLPRLASAYAQLNTGNPAGLFSITEPNAALDRQKQECATAAEDTVKDFAPTSPFFHDAQLLRLLTHRDLGLPIEPLLADLLEADPTRLELYERTASYAYVRDPELLPAWMDQCVAASKEEIGEGAYALMADMAFTYRAVDRVPLEWTRIDRGYADLCQRYNSWTLPQRRLFWAIIFKKRARAQELAGQIGLAQLDFRVFSGWENLDTARKWLEQ